MELQSISGPARNVSELVTNKQYFGISLAYRRIFSSEVRVLAPKHTRFVIYGPRRVEAAALSISTIRTTRHACAITT